MTGSDFRLLCLSDDRLKPLATDPLPAWLWSADADRVLWANAAGAVLLGAETIAMLTARTFDKDHLLASQIVRIASALDHAAPARLERLRGLGPQLGRPLTCACSHLVVAGIPALLVTAVEPVGRELPLVQRVRGLLADLPGPLAAFSADNELLYASADARTDLGLPIEALASHRLTADAVAAGRAVGYAHLVEVSIDRIGSGAAIVLVARRAPPPSAETATAEQEDEEETSVHSVSATPSPGIGEDVAPSVTDNHTPTLTSLEWAAFRELSRKLRQHLSADGAAGIDMPNGEPEAPPPAELARDAVAKLEAELAAARAATEALAAMLDAVSDGVVVLDRHGVVRSANRSAEQLLGLAAGELISHRLADVIAPESANAVRGCLADLARDGPAPHTGAEVSGERRDGSTIPLFITIARLDGTGKLCGLIRDLSPWKQAEASLADARQRAEQAAMAKSGLLAKISHEIRAPLSTVIGFSEIMMEERFGPLSNARYREYLEGIHASGSLLIALISNLLELSMIETGKLELNFASVSLNDLIRQCVTATQPYANRERIIIRSSLAPALPRAIADARCVRQIVLNLISDAIGLAGAGGQVGGQVIVSTACDDAGDAILRVRDTGVGMSEHELLAALEPFRPPGLTVGGPPGGIGLGLPLTKALAEANRARFLVKSSRRGGTLVEIAFPTGMVVRNCKAPASFRCSGAPGIEYK